MKRVKRERLASEEALKAERVHYGPSTAMWWLLVVCLTVPFLVVLTVFLSHPTHIAFGEEMNWISAIGAIVGGIGAVGGIVVGMISLITLSQIDRQVKAEFDERYKDHQLELDEQSRTWATGIKLWAQSSMTSDLNQAADLLRTALMQWPTAPNARIDMLQRLYDVTERAYFVDILPGRRQQVISNEAIHSLNSGGYFPSPLPETCLPECLEWWTIAREHESKGNEAIIAYLGSKLYAMSDRFDMSMRLLRARLSYGDLKATNRDMLVWAKSASNTDNFTELLDILISSAVKDVRGSKWMTSLYPNALEICDTVETLKDMCADRLFVGPVPPIEDLRA